jgi:hypothetical protein
METRIVCKVQPSLLRGYFLGDTGDQIFVICKKGAEYVMGQKVKNRSTFLAYVDMKFIRYIKEKPMKPFNSNKTQLGVLSAWGICIFGVLALKYLELPIEVIKIGVGAVTAIVCTHILGHAITDAAVNFGVGKNKK